MTPRINSGAFILDAFGQKQSSARISAIKNVLTYILQQCQQQAFGPVPP
ncbi:hypothetical protein [Microcoleus sp. LAD1_D3]